MKVDKRFFSVGLSILLSSLLVILLVNPGMAGTSETQMTGVYEEGTVVVPYEGSSAWAAESDEEYKESEDQEQSEEMATEEEGSGYESAPSDEEHGYSSEESPDEESMHMNPHEDDDLAHAPKTDE